MPVKRHVALQLALLPLLIGVTAVAAPDDRANTARDRSAGSSNVQSAPVGHRQPTAADVAKVQPTPSDQEHEKRDRALDKRLQICRGC